MNKLLTSPIFNYILLYIAGAIATLSLPPFSILPLIIGINKANERVFFLLKLEKKINGNVLIVKTIMFVEKLPTNENI